MMRTGSKTNKIFLVPVGISNSILDNKKPFPVSSKKIYKDILQGTCINQEICDTEIIATFSI